MVLNLHHQNWLWEVSWLNLKRWPIGQRSQLMTGGLWGRISPKLPSVSPIWTSLTYHGGLVLCQFLLMTPSPTKNIFLTSKEVKSDFIKSSHFTDVQLESMNHLVVGLTLKYLVHGSLETRINLSADLYKLPPAKIGRFTTGWSVFIIFQNAVLYLGGVCTPVYPSFQSSMPGCRGLRQVAT